jgi:signal transduction histidine kinase
VEEQIIQEIILEAAQGGTTGSQFLTDVRRTAVIAFSVAGMAAILFMTLISRQITRPLTRLRLTTQALAQGDLNARVPIQSNDEVGKVAAAFNQMASQLQRNELARQQMVADVAHELRTPLSVMQSNIEAMMDGLLEPNPGELAELHGEVGRLARMVEDLRLLSLADAGQLQLTRAPLDAGKLIERVVGLMAPMAEAHAVNLKSNIPLLPVIINGDKDKLQQALTNLIDNAVRHAPAGGQVTVGVAHTKQTVFISVADNGPGISAADLPHIFERFWRGDKSRSRHSGGSGLGLSIVKQVAELHGGTVQVVSPESGGTQFTIALPLTV